MRIEVFYKPKFADGRATSLLATLRRLISDTIEDLAIADVFVIDGIPPLSKKDVVEIFADAVAQEAVIDACAGGSGLLPAWTHMIEISSRPGVTDPVAITAHDAVRNHIGCDTPADALFQTAVKYLVRAPKLTQDELGRVSLYLHNPLIQTASVITRAEWEQGKRFPARYPHRVTSSPVTVASFDIGSMTDAELVALSKTRLLALSSAEMAAVRAYFVDPETITARAKSGLGPGITDVELEMIAQTWSEHCKHKIFNATIRYDEGGKIETIRSIFKSYIKRTTDEVSQRRHFLRSVFHDNSGVVQFDDETLLCFKVETHNSPSALDPYGGAITGIVGVNRDIIGTGRGARPIFNTNFLCFGFPDTPAADVPAGILHPRRVMSGVHKGIIDGGNQSGIPVVAGGFLFDESYLGKPLVYCGTGGILPAKVGGRPGWEKYVRPGDLAVMTGGRIGKDGIHGATFSSLALDEESPPSAVQIGDPITQKKMLDMLLEARDLGLYEGLTDNGAGGLSSSLGEMATLSGGVLIDLDACPLKYQGLAPWEILVSESQERMSLAVSPDRIDRFLALAKKRDVEATVVGAFTDSGRVEVRAHGKTVASIGLDFLHDGLPVMELDAVWDAAAPVEREVPRDADPAALLLALLADPNIASREELVRQYDHEVQGQSVVKPFAGVHADAPSDGAVLRPVYGSPRGITVTHGVSPRYGDVDAYHMAACALDEAFRAHIALGGDPERASALDNFCWPDPIASAVNPDGKKKLAQLVRACRGLYDTCIAYGVPLISGKDSMKNDAVVGGKKISVRPTLLVSLIGFIDDVARAMTTDFKKPGDYVYVAGNTRGELGGTVFERISGFQYGRCPEVRTREALPLYRAIADAIGQRLVASCHDLSDGGLGVALAESALGGRLGADISIDLLPGTEAVSDTIEDARLLFCETPSRFVLTVDPGKKESFEKAVAGMQIACVGRVTEDRRLTVSRRGRRVLDVGLDAIEIAWKTRI